MAETRKWRLSFAILFSAAVALCAVPGMVRAEADVSDAAGECLGCHEDEGMEMDIAGGGVLRLFVAPGAYGESVHGSMDCTDCHGGVSTDDHPEGREIADLDEYRKGASESCGDCHSTEDLGEEMHRHLVSSDDAPACSACHDPHAVRPVEEWKAEAGASEYCLACHGQHLALSLENGESLSLNVDRLMIERSVHLSHDCSDCHSEFSGSGHPVRAFTSRREHSVTLAELCTQCHEDKNQQFEGSIHHTLLEGGNLAVPVCTDCHGFHTVKEAETIARLSGQPCRRCHGEIFEAFGSSRHGRENESGHFEAPVCADCHRAHEVRPALWAEEMRASCISCHSQVQDAHDEWLPNSELHLEAVACPACHAPRAERGIELVLGEAGSGRPMDAEKLIRLSAAGGSKALDGAEPVDAVALWSLLRRVNGNGSGEEVSLTGRVRIRSGIDAHRMESKNEALRDCEACHQPGASPYQNVTITLIRGDGRPLRFEADGKLLSSITSVDSLRGFYVLGGTRIRLLDFLLIAAVLGGMSVPALHMTARALAGKKG